MAADISGAEPRHDRVPLHFGTITIVGGGCYGGYYVRQLGRAHAAGALTWGRIVVVDRSPFCAVAALAEAARPPRTMVAVAEWGTFFEEYLTEASNDPEGHVADAIVPSPLMPHLMADWIVTRAQRRWPARLVSTAPLATPPDVPWQRAGEDGTHYVSFAEWMCPINCIEPQRCPATRGERTWSMPSSLAQYAETLRGASHPVAGAFVFHCTHRAFGVGMIDVADVLAADAAIAAHEADDSFEVLIGTASHCHGALRRVVIGNG